MTRYPSRELPKVRGDAYRCRPFGLEVDDLKCCWRKRGAIFVPVLLGLHLDECRHAEGDQAGCRLWQKVTGKKSSQGMGRSLWERDFLFCGWRLLINLLAKGDAAG